MNASTDCLLRRTRGATPPFPWSRAPCCSLCRSVRRIAAHGTVALLGLDLAIVFELLGVGAIVRRVVRLGRST